MIFEKKNNSSNPPMAIWMERERGRESMRRAQQSALKMEDRHGCQCKAGKTTTSHYAHTTAFFDETKSQNVRLIVSNVQNVLKRRNSRDYGAPRGTQSSPKLRYKCYREPYEAQRSPLPKVHPPSKAPSQLWELSFWLTFSPFTQGSGDARKTHPFYFE